MDEIALGMCDYYASSEHVLEIDHESARSVVQKIDRQCRAERDR